MKKIAFVPMRGGSKGVPNKNIKNFCGRPLCYWVINELCKSKNINEIVISSDSEDIINEVKSFNISRLQYFKQSEYSANDINLWEYAVDEFINSQKLEDEDVLVMCQVTSPFTKSYDFDNGINLYLNNEGSSIVTCAKTHRFVWRKEGTPLNYEYLFRPRRQDFKGLLVENGAFCISSVYDFKRKKNRLSGDRIVVYEMPEYTFTEIDTEDDWFYAEYLKKIHD